MPLTLRQVIDQIKAVADAHAQINGVGVGDFAELQSQTRVYPLFWIFHERSEVVEGYIVRRIRLLCADRVQTGQEGDDDDGMEIEVLSDTQRILMDFIAYFAQQHNQAYIVDRVGSIDPFTERFDDRVAGNTVLLTIKEAWDYSKCETPISTVNIPPTVDGLTLYDFGDASVLGRLTAQQVADLEAAYATVCSNATAVLKNTANTTISTTSIASGASQNITAPDATAVLKNTANTTLLTEAIPSNVSENITAPDGTYLHRDSAGNSIGSGSIMSGQIGVIIIAPDGSYSLRDTASNVLATGNIRSNQTGVVITAPDGTYSLRNTAGTVLGTGSIRSGQLSVVITAPDATITLNGAAYGSAPSGTTFNVVATAPSLSLSTTTSTPAYGASFTITATPTGITPTAYTWYANGIQIGTGPSLTWTVNVAGAITLTCVATDATRAVVGSTSITSTVPRNSGLYGDGVNDSAVASWKPSATFATSESWSFWFKTNPLGGYRMVLLCGYPTTVNSFCWYLAVNGSALDLRFGEAGGSYGGSIAYTANVWNHMLVSRTNTGSTIALKAWLNGVAVINTSGATTIGSNMMPNLFFGQNPYGLGRERCSIAAISHYTGAAALADATALYNSGTPLAMPTTGTGNLTLQEYFPFMESPVVPSTNYGTPTAVAGINGGRLYCGQGYASPYGLVADIP